MSGPKRADRCVGVRPDVCECEARRERRLRVVLDGVVDLVGSVSHVPQDGVGLFDEIDLEPDVVDDLVAVPCDGYDGDQVDAIGFR